MISSAEIVLGKGKLCAGIIIIYGLLNIRQQREKFRAGIGYPAVLAVIFIVKRPYAVKAGFDTAVVVVVAAGTLSAFSLGFGVVMYVKHVQKPLSAAVPGFFHFVQIVIYKPAVTVVCFKLLPVWSSREAVKRGISEKRRTENLCSGICFLYDGGKLR